MGNEACRRVFDVGFGLRLNLEGSGVLNRMLGARGTCLTNKLSRIHIENEVGTEFR